MKKKKRNYKILFFFLIESLLCLLKRFIKIIFFQFVTTLFYLASKSNMATAVTQCRALLLKQLTLQSRQKKTLACQIIFPVIVILALWVCAKYDTNTVGYKHAPQ